MKKAIQRVKEFGGRLNLCRSHVSLLLLLDSSPRWSELHSVERIRPRSVSLFSSTVSKASLL